MPRRIIILGGPRVGKTTLSKRLQKELAISTLNSADDLRELGWSESSEVASRWFDNSQGWICEGVQMARALRKWLKANPGAPLDADAVYLRQPFVPLLPGQLAMTKGVRTVFKGIEQDLVSRGVRVHKLKNPEDAITILRGADMPDEDEEKDGKEKETKEVVGLKKRLDKHQGDATALAAELFAENTDLNRQLSAAKGQKPKEGSLVLSPDQAKQWNAFIALGKPEDIITAYEAYKAHGTPEEIKTKLTERDTFETENATLKKGDVLRQVADEEKLKFSVLKDLDIRDGGLQYEKRDVTVDGKTSQTWHVKKDNKWLPLSQYRESSWADYKGALETVQETSGGTKIPDQKKDPGTQKPNLYSRIRQDAEERNKKKKEESIPLEKRLNLVA